jgi:hypothetical protein
MTAHVWNDSTLGPGIRMRKEYPVLGIGAANYPGVSGNSTPQNYRPPRSHPPPRGHLSR